MPNDSLIAYSPINTLKCVADNLWIVDGPVIRFGLPWPKFSFPTRMTIIRLKTGDLFVHSPTALTPALREVVGSVGKPRFLIAPNRIHYWWLPEWKTAYRRRGGVPRAARQGTSERAHRLRRSSA